MRIRGIRCAGVCQRRVGHDVMSRWETNPEQRYPRTVAMHSNPEFTLGTINASIYLRNTESTTLTKGQYNPHDTCAFL